MTTTLRVFFPTRFHIFDQLAAGPFPALGDRLEIYSIYPGRWFRRGRHAALERHRRTLWLGLALRGLLRLGIALRLGRGARHGLRSLYIRGSAAEFRLRLWAKAPGLVLSSAGYLGTGVAALRRSGHRVVVNHGSLYEPSVRDRLAGLPGADADAGANWADDDLMARMDAEFDAADLILVCSPAARDSFPARLQDRVRVVALGAPEPIAGAGPGFRGRLEGAGVTFLHISNLSFGKNVRRIVEAFARVRQPEDRLLIGGPLPSDPDLREILGAPPPGVQWLGRLDRGGVMLAMAEADVFVHPSLADGWAMVVTEALASGLPVVASPFTGAACFYADGRSDGTAAIELADPLDVGAIAAGMQRLRPRGASATARPAEVALLSWAESAGQLARALDLTQEAGP